MAAQFIDRALLDYSKVSSGGGAYFKHDAVLRNIDQPEGVVATRLRLALDDAGNGDKHLCMDR